MSDIDTSSIDAIISRRLKHSRTGRIQVKLYRLMKAAGITPQRGSPFINGTTRSIPQVETVRHLFENYSCKLYGIGARVHGGSPRGAVPIQKHMMELDDGREVEVAYSMAAIYDIAEVET